MANQSNALDAKSTTVVRSVDFQAQKKNQKKHFVFLAHWVENWNWLLWWAKGLHEKPQSVWKWMWMWPIYSIMSIVYMVGKKDYDEVDHFTSEGNLEGHTWLVRNFAWHFLKASWQESIRQRILRAVLDAQSKNYSVVGLGALTKAEWLTEGGAWIVRRLGNELTIPIVHGDTLTAIVVYRRAIELFQAKRTITPVFITGATSKIGRAVTLLLAKRKIHVVMYTQSYERFKEIAKEAGEDSKYITRSDKLADGQKCLLWITGKADPVGKKIIKHLPKNAMILNFSVPDPFLENVLRKRKDVKHYDGGLLGYDSTKTDLHFTMRLVPGLTYACHAGTFVHAYKGWKHHEVGHVEMDQVDEVWRAAQDIGFFMPEYTSFLRPVSME